MSTNSSVRRQAGNLKQEGEHAIRSAATSPLMEKLIRLGYIARGLVWGIIGILAFQVALGSGGKLTNQQGAIAALGSAPGGKILLYVMLVGLIGYALWGVIRAIVDPLHQGKDAKGIAQRIGFLVSGISYGLLAVATYGLITAKTTAASAGVEPELQEAIARLEEFTAKDIVNWGGTDESCEFCEAWRAGGAAVHGRAGARGRFWRGAGTGEGMRA